MVGEHRRGRFKGVQHWAGVVVKPTACIGTNSDQKTTTGDDALGLTFD